MPPNNSFKRNATSGVRLIQALGPVIISFEGPTFFAPADEGCFFRWLASLPEYKDIRGTGTILELTLDSPVEPDTVRQLLVIFRRWLIDVTPLLPLRSSETSNLALWDTALDGSPGPGPNNSFKPNPLRGSA
jgi:hypothetical protein